MPTNNDLAATPGDTASLTPPYKDRSAGLMIFGVLTILLGCLSALLVPLMFLGQAMAAKSGAPAMPMSSVLPGVLVYGLMAVALVWLGIGSIMARRWARALLLIFSWSWLVMGVFMTFFMAYFMPKMLANLPANGQAGQPALPQALLGMVMVFTFLFLGFFFVLLPAIWTFFYGSRNVKETCEARDPVRRWTDVCPLPVLALVVWSWFSAPMMLVLPLAANGVMPFFGMFLSGFPGTIFCVAVAAIWFGAAWWMYKLDMRGWWLILTAFCLLMASSLLTFTHHDIIEMYRLMDYPEAQIAQIQKSGLFTGNGMAWMMSLWMVPYLAYVFYIRKYFHREA